MPLSPLLLNCYLIDITCCNISFNFHSMEKEWYIWKFSRKFNLNFNLFFICSILYFLGLKGYEVLQLLNKNYRLPQPANCPRKFYSIMLDCWKEIPKERPKFETLYYKFEDYFETDFSYDANNFERFEDWRTQIMKHQESRIISTKIKPY